MRLYTYWRSTTSYRVRIALNLKGIAFQAIPIDLVNGDQKSPEYTRLNPGQGVPTLELEDGSILSQSMAILEFLEETYPQPPLLPVAKGDRAKVRAAGMTIATDIHPVNNLRVVRKLKSMGHDQAAAVVWMNEWMKAGLTAFQDLIEPNSLFCFGDQPGLADICLVPQLYNAHRWGMDLTRFSRLTEVEARCLDIPAFRDACPENQPDAA